MPQETAAADAKGRVETVKKRGTWVKKPKAKAEASKPEPATPASPAQTSKVEGHWKGKGWLADAGTRWPGEPGLPALAEPEVFLGDIEGYWGADVWSALQDPITDTYPPGAGFPWTWPLLGHTLCLGDNDEEEADHAEDAKDAVVLRAAAGDALEGGAAADSAKLPEKSP